MKKRLKGKELVLISSMLFGMFFGAGNLIFPATLGVAAGNNIIFAFLGMFFTAVGLPLLAVAALGSSRSRSVLDIAMHAGKPYGIIFSTLLYLTIGPLFAIPRCAGTSFAIGKVVLGENVNATIALVVFSSLFFIAVLIFSLFPGNIMTWIGKILNPLFLLLLFCLIVVALIHPISRLSDSIPIETYLVPGTAFVGGFLEGYNTLDALAGLAFGIVVVNAVRKTGVEEPNNIASATIQAGIFSCLLMGIVYFLLSIVTAQSSSLCRGCTNGSEILGVISQHYFGKGGAILLFAIVTMACLKTAIGLVTSCAEAFSQMFSKGKGYRRWTVLFVFLSFAIANVGLTNIVSYCVPVLMFLYPLAIILILLSLCGNIFQNSGTVFFSTFTATLVAAFLDFCRALEPLLDGGSKLDIILKSINLFAGKWLPLFHLGLGWILPAFVGFAIGMIITYKRRKHIK